MNPHGVGDPQGLLATPNSVIFNTKQPQRPKGLFLKIISTLPDPDSTPHTELRKEAH